MPRRLVYALIAALVSTGAVVAASQPPEAVREAVRAEIATAMGPVEAGDPAHPAPSAAMFKRIDINQDGLADWRVDFEKAPNPSYFCGTGGCRQRLYVSQPDGPSCAGQGGRRRQGEGLRGGWRRLSVR
jgi:hypothetical protein